MYQGYGQSEALPIAMMGRGQWFAEDVPGSQPLPFAQLQIWNQDNKPVQPGQAGEIVAKCKSQMRGFLNNSRRVVDGWVKTGNIGRLDANGSLYMLDRAECRSVSHGEEPVELRSVHQDSGRQDQAQGTSRAVPGCSEAQGRRQRTACAARLRERVKRCAQFTFCVGCYETVVLRALSV